jgi:hypothetical protein
MSNTQIRVAFVAPANGGSAITGYTATCTSSDGGAAGIASAASSPVLVRNLTNGKLYTCTVHATNAEGSSVESASSSSIRPGVSPVYTSGLTITGAAVKGRTLTAHDGTWRASPAATFTRQWVRCNLVGSACVNIAGQGGHTYVLRAADVNHRIRVVVTATNVLGATSKSSMATGKVTNG